MQKRVRWKQKCALACQCACQNVHTKIYAFCAHIFTQNFTKIELIVLYYVMTLILKFHKDPSFCWGDMRKIMLNMHARGINACSKFWYMFVHIFALCPYVYAQIFTNFFLLVHYYVMSLSFKFHKNLIFCWGDICKIELCVFFCRYCICIFWTPLFSSLHPPFNNVTVDNPRQPLGFINIWKLFRKYCC